MKKDYILFILLLAFTTFEYFFRAELLSWFLYLFAGLICLSNQHIYNKKIFSKTIIVYITIFLSCYLIQTIFLDNYYFTSLISRGVVLIGPLLVAAVIEQRAIRIFVQSMYWISIISLIIYIICFIPGIYDFLFNKVAINFTSLNVENAVFEGGGKNIIIYNFLSGNTLEGLGIRRNCGPFWEPGQFGVYICIALFFNLFVEKQHIKYANQVLTISLISTCSTGAYIGGLFIFMLYALLKSNNKFVTILYLIALILVWQQISQLEFMSEKITSQIDNAEIGNDISRFSAFLTQVEMIRNSPILGGERFSDYLDMGSKTLASGTLLPFVILGIPFGIIYLIYMCVSCCSLCDANRHKVIIGISYFILLLILSFSQTILMVPIIVTLIYVGLIQIANK